MTHLLLDQGVSAALSGRRDEARQLLTRVVEDEQNNEQAWLWLAGLVTEPEEMRTCLENVLHLNPDNPKAREGLAWVEQRYGRRPAAPGVEAPPDEAPAPQQTKEALAALLAETPRVVHPPAPPPPEPAPAPIPAPGEAQPAEQADTAKTGEAAKRRVETFPCVYCGAPARIEQRACPKCHNSLMIRAAPREKRSIALTILGILWILPGVLEILGGLAITALGLIAYTTVQSHLPHARGAVPASFPIEMLVPLGAGLLSGIICIAIGRGLLKRRRLLYLIILFLCLLETFALALEIASGAAGAPEIVRAISSPTLSQSDAKLATISAGAMMSAYLFAIGCQLIYILLVALSYRDFFGPMVRFQPELDDGSDMDSYNSGVAYKKRGMWYMAAQEWAVAVKKKPGDPVYLHALGLAHVQLKQFDEARATLDRALAIAPDDAELRESRAAVDRLDKPRKKR